MGCLEQFSALRALFLEKGVKPIRSFLTQSVDDMRVDLGSDPRIAVTEPFSDDFAAPPRPEGGSRTCPAGRERAPAGRQPQRTARQACGSDSGDGAWCHEAS